MVPFRHRCRRVRGRSHAGKEDFVSGLGATFAMAGQAHFGTPGVLSFRLPRLHPRGQCVPPEMKQSDKASRASLAENE